MKKLQLKNLQIGQTVFVSPLVHAYAHDQETQQRTNISITKSIVSEVFADYITTFTDIEGQLKRSILIEDQIHFTHNDAIAHIQKMIVKINESLDERHEKEKSDQACYVDYLYQNIFQSAREQLSADITS